MKKKILINILLCLSLNSFSQKGNNKLFTKYEDSLKIMAHKIMNGKTEEERKLSNKNFIKTLNRVLQYKKSFEFPFDSLVTIARVKSPDNTFRIFNWILRKKNNTYEYYGIVHYFNKKQKKYELIPLIDNSANIRNPEHADLDAKNWYGSLIYDIIYVKNSGRKFYTLLSYDLNNQYSRKKIIDVLYFSGKNKIKFGLPIFKKSKNESQKRVILQYDARTLISVKFHKKDKKIVFDHLVPRSKDLKGMYEYYIPDGTFDAFYYKNRKWWLEKEIDIRNSQKTPKIKKPKKGLIPR